MEYQYLGDTGIQVSELCFGTMSFGGDADEQTSAAMFNRCRDAGVNFFDCANVYQRGRAEEILGRLMMGQRDELVITSKFRFPMSDDLNARGASRRNIMASVERSLKCLQTDRLALHFTIPEISTLSRMFGIICISLKIKMPLKQKSPFLVSSQYVGAGLAPAPTY